MALFNRGVAKAQQGDMDGEVADYTSVIDLPGAPADLVAEAQVILAKRDEMLRRAEKDELD